MIVLEVVGVMVGRMVGRALGVEVGMGSLRNSVLTNASDRNNIRFSTFLTEELERKAGDSRSGRATVEL